MTIHPRLMVLVFCAVAPAGCGKAAPAGGGAAPASASASPSASAPPLLRLAVEPFGAAVVMVKAAPGSTGKEVKALARAFAGDLEIDRENLERTRGTVTVDLASFAAHGSGDADRDEKLGARLRAALDVERMPLARFTIRSVSKASRSAPSAAPGAERLAWLETSGELDLHGVKREQALALTLRFVSAADAAPRVIVKSTPGEPLVVNLLAHGLTLRGIAGEEMAQEASVTFELSATPR